MKLYCYSDLNGSFGWFKTPADFRKAFPQAQRALRCAHPNIDPSVGYHKPNGHLANDPIERKPTMRDFIHALTS